VLVVVGPIVVVVVVVVVAVVSVVVVAAMHVDASPSACPYPSPHVHSTSPDFIKSHSVGVPLMSK